MHEFFEKWARDQWEESDLKDTRRNDRAIKIATSLIMRPDASLPNQFASWGDLKAAYRFFNTDAISHDALQENHRRQVIQAAAQEKIVLFIQDTSSLNYTDRQETAGMGPIGNHAKHKITQGIMIHSALAIALQESGPKVLGLAHQKTWIRDKAVRRKNKLPQDQRHLRESELWKNTLTAIPKPDDVSWVSVGDRANDIFYFFAFCQAHQWNYLIRANQDRIVIVHDTEKTHLKEWARTLPIAAKKTLYLRARDDAPAADVKLNVSWNKAAILRPRTHEKLYKSMQIDVWCIRCWEDAPGGIEWILLTNLPIFDAASALEKIDWYSARWTIEEYHKCLKTGCAIEKRQLRTRDALLAMLGFLGIIATKLLELKFLTRQNPTDLAKSHIPLFDLRILCKRFQLHEEGLTFQDYWRKIASLGGFIGRKSDGQPGWQTLWKGLIRFFDMIDGAEVLKRCG